MMAIKAVATLMVACIIPVTFSLVLYGISKNRGLLFRLFADNVSLRLQPPLYFKKTYWHILTDILFGAVFFLMVIIFEKHELTDYLALGFLGGILLSLEWWHFYAEHDIKPSVIAFQSLLSVCKATLTMTVTGELYAYFFISNLII